MRLNNSVKVSRIVDDGDDDDDDEHEEEVQIISNEDTDQGDSEVDSSR